MKALILGDVHGDWQAADLVIAKAREQHPDITEIWQVGDLGDGWPHKGKILRWNPKTADDLPIRWCDGNHDNHELLRLGDLNPRLIYQPRGSVIEVNGWRILWIGGAASIDTHHRTAYVDWWPEEEIEYADIERALNVGGTIDAVISHDRPANSPVTPKGSKVMPHGKGGRDGLQTIWEHYQPRFWFHGHYHWGLQGCMDNTIITACPAVGATNETLYQDDYVVWDGITTFPSW